MDAIENENSPRRSGPDISICLWSDLPYRIRARLGNSSHRKADGPHRRDPPRNLVSLLEESCPAAANNRVFRYATFSAALRLPSAAVQALRAVDIRGAGVS